MMDKKTAGNDKEKKALKPADLEYVSGGIDDTLIDGDSTDEEGPPEAIRKPFTRYPPSHFL